MERTKGFVYKGKVYSLINTPKGKLCKLCAFKDLFDPCATSPGCGHSQHYVLNKKIKSNDYTRRS